MKIKTKTENYKIKNCNFINLKDEEEKRLEISHDEKNKYDVEIDGFDLLPLGSLQKLDNIIFEKHGYHIIDKFRKL